MNVRNGACTSRWESGLWLCLLGVILMGTAQAAYLKSDHEEPSPPPPGRVIPRPLPPRRDHPVADLVRRIHVRPGHYYGGLVIFPLELRGKEARRDFLALDEALAKGVLTVEEKGSGSVPDLFFRNQSDRHIFVMAGEIVVGGKQNRTVRQDVLLPPRSDTTVPVYCVEEQRWSRPIGGFKSGRALSSAALRSRASAGRPQAEIWAEVRDQSAKLSVRSETRDLQRVYEDKATVAKLREYRQEFAKILPRPAVGLVAARNGRIVGADLFTDSALFWKLRQKIIDSYALDAVCNGPTGKFHMDAAEARRFLERTFRAEFWNEATPGSGTSGRLSSAGVTGRALLYRSAIVHAALFPSAPQPIIRPQPHPLPGPRRRLRGRRP